MTADTERGGDPSSACRSEGTREAMFHRMATAFAASGGLARHDASLANRPPCLSSGAAVGELMIAVDWQGAWWSPRFQFDPQTRSVRGKVQQVLGELAAFLDGWQAAAWFCEPNLWLGDHRPVDWIDDHPGCVLGAARADRFIANDKETP